jgi:uncharacterized membrane protein (UPF0127 family)
MRGLVVALLVLAATAARADDELERVFSKDVLIIEASRWACYRFDVYLAITDAQRSRGLMFVREMPDTTGMLFVYSGADIISMWMKNTFIPLDMVFALPDGRVSSVIANTEPQSLKSLYSIEPVAFVLELNAGTAQRLSIDTNSRLMWNPAHGVDD